MQAGIDKRTRKRLFDRLSTTAKQSSGELEVIKMEFLIFPYLLLFVGTLAGCVVYGLEMLSIKNPAITDTEPQLKAVDSEKSG